MGEYVGKVAVIRALLKDFKDERHTWYSASYAIDIMAKIVDEMPSAEVRPVVHGKWLHPEEDDEDYNTVSCSCSVCGWKFNYYEDDIDGAPYCAVCGAKMDIVSPLYQVEGGRE